MHLRHLISAAAVCSVVALVLMPTPAEAKPKRVCSVNQDGVLVCRVVEDGTPGAVVPGGPGAAAGAGQTPVAPPVLVGAGCPAVPAVNPAVPCAAAVPGVPAGPVVTPAQVGAMAAASLKLPSPKARRSPDDRLPDGRATTYVRLQTWFYVPVAQWKPLTVSATAGGVTATATATPTVLAFDPGDGSAAVSCAGPGRAWVFGQDKNFDVAPGGCSYAYLRSSYGYPGGMVTARYSITWSIRWTGAGGAGGVLPDVVTTSTSVFAVAEAQAVVQ